MKVLVLVVLSILVPLSIDAQSVDPGPVEAGGTVMAFERLEAKNRSRLFSDVASPGGEHYFYVDDHDLASGENLSPEVEVQPETRSVTTVINTFTSHRLDLAADSDGVGAVRLHGGASGAKTIDTQTTFNLLQPLRIRVRERSRTDSDH